MANLKELRTRIGSVKNTRKITSAMSRIAAARLAKAQNAVAAARPYATRLQGVVGSLVVPMDPADRAAAHVMLSPRSVRAAAVVVITADRGLCGGFNSNAIRRGQGVLDAHRAEGRETVLITVGKKARAAFAHLEEARHREFDGPAADTAVELSKAVAAEVLSLFSSEKVDQVELVYNHFVNVLNQEVVAEQLLPFTAEESEDYTPPPTIEPSAQGLLDHLLPVALESNIQQALLDSLASETAARRNAMDAATDNASELIDDLTLAFNRERQAAITSELMEIISGAESLKG